MTVAAVTLAAHPLAAHPLALAAAPLARTSEGSKSGPIGLAVILLLCIACYFLFKSMSGHLRRVREDFPKNERGVRASATTDAPAKGIASPTGEQGTDRATDPAATTDADVHADSDADLHADTTDARADGDADLHADTTDARTDGADDAAAAQRPSSDQA